MVQPCYKRVPNIYRYIKKRCHRRSPLQYIICKKNIIFHENGN